MLAEGSPCSSDTAAAAVVVAAAAVAVAATGMSGWLLLQTSPWVSQIFKSTQSKN